MLAGWEVSEDFVVPQARLGDWHRPCRTKASRSRPSRAKDEQGG